MPDKKTIINPNQANQTVVNDEMAGRTVINETRADKTIIDEGMSNKTIRPTDATKVDLPPVQKEANRQKAAEAIKKAKAKGGNELRPNPNKTAIQKKPVSGKTTEIRKPGSEPTKIRPKSEITKITERPTEIPEPMRPADLEEELATAKKGKAGKTPDLKKLHPGKTLPEGAPGLAEYEKTLKAGKKIGFGSKARSILKGVGKIVAVGAVLGVIGFAIIDHIGVAVFEHAADEVLNKIGKKTDLSGYLPGGAKAKRIIWSTASYRRYKSYMGGAPLDTYLIEEMTLNPPQNGILALGIAVNNWPDDIFVSEINVNESNDGQSDWLCEGFKGYLVCRSLGSYPLNSKLKTLVSLHLAAHPAYEVDKMIAEGAGSRPVYFIVK